MVSFNRQSAERVGRSTRRVERTPINNLMSRSSRSLPQTSEFVRQVKALRDEFRDKDIEEEVDGEIVTNTYNAEIAGVTPTKFMNVVTGYVNGFHAKNSVHFAVKVKGNWYLASDGYMAGKIFIGEDALYTADDTRLDDHQDDDSPTLNIQGQGDRFSGLLDGHEVYITCSHRTVWNITRIEKEFLSGTYDEAPAPYGEDYEWNNPIGWSLLPGVNVYGVYNGGFYDIIAAGCGQEE